MLKMGNGLVLALLMPLVGCSGSVTSTPDGGADQGIPGSVDLGSGSDLGTGGGSGQSILVDPRSLGDVDILFVIDNSPSMSPKQKVLATAIPKFISAIDAIGINYHVGITTTDLGYNPLATTGTTAPWNALPTCNTYSGDDGVLQNIPCTSRAGLSGEAAAACTALCPDPKYVPKNGERYISKVNGITNVPSFTMGGKDIGPQLAFQCMALVGDVGCGVEHQLESAKRALDNHRPDNGGFNRQTSVLAVIFITDEDDCSVQLSQRNLFDPTTPNASSPACTTPTATPGVNPQCYNIDYRCIARDLTCTEPMNSKGAKTGCTERADTFLNPISQYVDFFSGLTNPNLVIGGIWTPTLLDNLGSNPAKDGQLFANFVNGSMDSAGLNRGRKTEAACYNPDPNLTMDPNGFFGQAQLRLSSFIRRFPSANVSESSVCDANNYPTALTNISDKILNKLGATCFAKPPKMVGGTPACVVGYVDIATPKAPPAVQLPVCSAKCCNYFATDSRPNAANDPNIPMPNSHLAAELAACSADPDCYCAVPSASNCVGGAVAGLWRSGNAAPPGGKFVSFQCQP